MAKLAVLARQYGALQAQQTVAEKLGYDDPGADQGDLDPQDLLNRRHSYLRRMLSLGGTGAAMGGGSILAGGALAGGLLGGLGRGGVLQRLRGAGRGVGIGMGTMLPLAAGGAAAAGALGAGMGGLDEYLTRRDLQRAIAEGRQFNPEAENVSREALHQTSYPKLGELLGVRKQAAGIDLAALLAKRTKSVAPSIASVAGHAGLPAMAQAAAARRPPPVAKASIQQMLAGKHAAATCEHGCPMSGDCSKCGRCEHGKTPSGDCKLSHGKMAVLNKESGWGGGIARGLAGAGVGGLVGAGAGAGLGGLLGLLRQPDENQSRLDAILEAARKGALVGGGAGALGMGLDQGAAGAFGVRRGPLGELLGVSKRAALDKLRLP
jgi:hypothetical protein